MTAPRISSALETMTESWMRQFPEGAAHVIRPVRDLGWATPCGALLVQDLGKLIPAGDGYRCGRCEQQLDRERVSIMDPCTGCTSPTCHDCVIPTEDRMLTWLAHHYARQGGGNGPRYGFARQVRAHAGFDARTADAVAMDLWKSKGLQLHGHEVKISRGDWLAELRDPEKWRGVGRYMDRWWLAVPDIDIVHGGELPADWGLLLCTPTKVHVVRRAPKLEPDSVDRSFLAALFRAAVKSGVVQ